jgi:NAD(P)-dependent dehydrogenase (short-subunit alcohol dehydrogenase family)
LNYTQVKDLAAEPHNYRVFAACRTPDAAADLHKAVAEAYCIDDKDSGSITVVEMDITSGESIAAAFARVTNNLYDLKRLDLLINNAGIASPQHPSDPILSCPTDVMQSLFATNCCGALSVIQTFWPLIEKTADAVILNMSSSLGSIARSHGDVVSYRCSKAALNQLTVTLSQECAGNGRIFCPVNPGWVDTDMGAAGDRKPHLTVEESSTGLLKVLTDVQASRLQQRTDAVAADADFLASEASLKQEIEKKLCVMRNYDGSIIPW